MEEGEGGFDSENLVVVAFYLITRESGLLFQHLANFVTFIEDVTNSINYNNCLE
jgi:hypothetical protein